MAGNVTPLVYPYAPIAGSGQHNLTTASSTALTVPNGAVYAIVQAAAAAVKYTTDGSAPTVTVGMTLASGSALALNGYASIVAFRAISSGATLDVEYFQ